MSSSQCLPPQAAPDSANEAEQTVQQALQLAITHHQAARVAEAEQLYKAILDIRPNHPDASHNLGLLLIDSGATDSGLSLLAAALEASPEQGLFWESYIHALMQAGQHDTAREVLQLGLGHGLTGTGIDALAAQLGLPQEAEPIAPPEVQGHTQASKRAEKDKGQKPQKSCGRAPTQDEIQHASQLYFHRKFDELERVGRLLSARYPLHGFGWKVLGDACYQQGKTDEALVHLNKVVRLFPWDAEAHNNLGVALRDKQKFAEAEASLRKALALNPDYVDGHSNLGLALKDQRRFAEAEASLRRALELNPNFTEAHNNLGIVLRDDGRPDQAQACLRRALELKPDFFPGHYNLGLAQRDLGQLTEAEISFRKALALNDSFADAYNNLGITLKDMSRLTEAEQTLRQAIALSPGSADWYSNLGAVLQDQARLQESIDTLRQALALNPHNHGAFSNLLFCMSELGDVDPDTLFAEHRRFGETFEPLLSDKKRPHGNFPDPERSLRIGFVSADFRSHAVASFIEPLLADLAARPGLTLHAYYNYLTHDTVTDRLRGYFTQWRMIGKVDDETVERQIREDGIDILVDLSGHTSENRLLLFARKPAPVQVSWIGYPGSTGLQAMDYYLSDRFLAPAEQFAGRFTEKIAYLPASAPFLPDRNAPPVNALPALENGYLTFGSFNRPSKISRNVIAVWAQLLRALPESRMLLGAIPDSDTSVRLAQWFAEEGVGSDRLTFHARTDMLNYQRLHHLVDVCLDTFPYGGATTTLTALWMGVPTIALVGETLAARTGACILGHCGLDEFIVPDKDAFLRQGLALAENNFATLAQLRTQSRQRFAASSPSQPALIADSLARAFRMMWQRWCGGLPAESFDVHATHLSPVPQPTHEAAP